MGVSLRRLTLRDGLLSTLVRKAYRLVALQLARVPPAQTALERHRDIRE